ncbi:HPP family protein [Tritonibacter multivorans]|uniref:HPP family protein n=1 Tax=Tritonibacter multivorans TaxID=928856 RepID=A0A0P1GF84_9RHOB|nr:HPP family protein [Tritonibacter multivorans]MDA7421016.1 HPP family protein [Tritonibacter multivorans]CUH80343.1 HPP family protein [Tritonibacter multivorans]SFC78419.1 HPP family protein [Tritonibacter multivorans]
MKAAPRASWLVRPQPKPKLFAALFAGVGGGSAIAALSLITQQADILMLMAPFGATCVLLFALPQSPLSQPANVIGGHLLSTAVGLSLRLAFPDSWWAVGLAVGLAISLMSLLRVTHPPAGADPIVVFVADPGFEFLLTPVLAGSVALVGMATLFHRGQGGDYPNV